MKENKYYDTATQIIGGTRYCVYCAQEAEQHVETGSYHNNIPDKEYYNCSCEGAAHQRCRDTEVQQVMDHYRPMLKENKQALWEIQYQYDLAHLNRRYGK